MADVFEKEKRSQIMAAISSKETRPEIAVRKFLFAQGYRFRKNVSSLRGKPDIVLPKFKTIIFIHGCFWHGHKNCEKANLPKSNIVFWTKKIQANIIRDRQVKTALKKSGWKVITIWECKIMNKNSFRKAMQGLLKRIES